MSRYNFKFGDTWISELGAVSTTPPPVEIAQRDFSLIDIPGKDGSDYIDNGRYMNVEITRSVSLIGRANFPVQDKAVNFINAMAYLQGYQTFEDTDHNDMVTEAVLTNFDEVNRTMRTLYSAKMKFSRKPYWYLKTGLIQESYTVSQLTSGVTLYNPFMAIAKPTIGFRLQYGERSTDLVLSISTVINGTRVTKAYTYSLSWDNRELYTFCIDMENQRLSILKSSGAVVRYIEGDVPECFGPGSTTFQITSGSNYNSGYIIPKWRCL